MKNWFCLMLLVTAFSLRANVVERYYFTSTGTSTLKSETPLELIKATSDKVTGMIDPLKRTVFLKIPMASFKDYTDKSRQQLINEKILETEKYPFLIFTGRLPSDFSELKKGMQSVYVFGTLTAHGVTREKTLLINIFNAEQMLVVNTIMGLSLPSYQMEVPKSLTKNIASEWKMEINARMKMNFAAEIPDLNTEK